MGNQQPQMGGGGFGNTSAGSTWGQQANKFGMAAPATTTTLGGFGAGNAGFGSTAPKPGEDPRTTTMKGEQHAHVVLRMSSALSRVDGLHTGGFGATATPSFGTPNTGTSLFGQPQQQQQQAGNTGFGGLGQQQQTTGLGGRPVLHSCLVPRCGACLGGTVTVPQRCCLFGGGNSSLTNLPSIRVVCTGGGFGGFGTPGASALGTPGQTTSLFGQAPAAAPTGFGGAGGFGSTTSPSTGFGGFGGAATANKPATPGFGGFGAATPSTSFGTPSTGLGAAKPGGFGAGGFGSTG